MLDVVLEIDSRDERCGSAGHGVQRPLQAHAISAEEPLHDALHCRNHAAAANQEDFLDLVFRVTTLVGGQDAPSERFLYLAEAFVPIEQPF